MSSEDKGLLERAKDAVVEAATEGAHKVLHKIEELAPDAVAAPVHRIVEAAATALPSPAEAHEKQERQEPRFPATPATVTAAPPSDAAKSPKQQPKKSNVRPPALVAASKPVFKTKRGQKHR